MAPSSSRNRRGLHCLVRSGDGRQLLIRSLVQGYAEVEKAMNFSSDHATRPSCARRWSIVTIVAGVACAAVTPTTRWPVYVFALLLLALFVPVHVSLWDKFPIWYHIVCLGFLFPLVKLGTKLLGPRGTGSET